MSNWLKLKQKIAVTKPPRPDTDEAVSEGTSSGKKKNTSRLESNFQPLEPLTPEEIKFQSILRRLRDKAVALDCEMVGTGPEGKVSELARCTLVDARGTVLFDEFVQPKAFVTDFRTQWSGIRKKDINKTTAITLEECQAQVVQLLEGKLLVGHALRNDLSVLYLSHPFNLIRDTAHYTPLMRTLPSGKKRSRALRDLVKQYLGREIQKGEHDSAEDARCAMELYLLHQRDWEQSLREKKEKKREGKTAGKGKKAAKEAENVEEEQGGDSEETSTERLTNSTPTPSKKRPRTETSLETRENEKRPRLFSESDRLFSKHRETASSAESGQRERGRRREERGGEKRDRKMSKTQRRLLRKKRRREKDEDQ